MGVAKPEQMITILIVEDIAEIRANFKKMLGFEQDFEVVGMAATGQEGLQLWHRRCALMLFSWTSICRMLMGCKLPVRLWIRSLKPALLL